MSSAIIETRQTVARQTGKTRRTAARQTGIAPKWDAPNWSASNSHAPKMTRQTGMTLAVKDARFARYPGSGQIRSTNTLIVILNGVSPQQRLLIRPIGVNVMSHLDLGYIYIFSCYSPNGYHSNGPTAFSVSSERYRDTQSLMLRARFLHLIYITRLVRAGIEP